MIKNRCMRGDHPVKRSGEAKKAMVPGRKMRLKIIRASFTLGTVEVILYVQT
jgi:hypothetical protein